LTFVPRSLGSGRFRTHQERPSTCGTCPRRCNSACSISTRDTHRTRCVSATSHLQQATNHLQDVSASCVACIACQHAQRGLNDGSSTTSLQRGIKSTFPGPLYWCSPESDGVWCKSRQLHKLLCSPSRGWWRLMTCTSASRLAGESAVPASEFQGSSGFGG
jgi:hypothetical protein